MAANELDRNSSENLVCAAYLSAQFGFNQDHVRGNPCVGKGFELRWKRLGVTEILLANEYGVRTWEVSEFNPQLLRLELRDADTFGVFPEDRSITLSSKRYYEGDRQAFARTYILPFKPEFSPTWKEPPLNPADYSPRKIKEIYFEAGSESETKRAIAVFRGIRDALHAGV